MRRAIADKPRLGITAGQPGGLRAIADAPAGRGRHASALEEPGERVLVALVIGPHPAGKRRAVIAGHARRVGSDPAVEAVTHHVHVPARTFASNLHEGTVIKVPLA